MSEKLRWVIKIGGSLDKNGTIDSGARGNSLLRVLESLAEDIDFIVIPGGGAFADFVRERAEQRRTPDSVSHIQAILSMAQFGYELADKIVGASAAHTMPQTLDFWKNGVIPVFIPYPFILEDTEIPANWDSTSDTIAARVCHAMNVKKLALVKSVDGIPGHGETIHRLPADEAQDTDLVDPGIFRQIKDGLEVYIVNGRKPETLKQLPLIGSAAAGKVCD